MPLFPNPAALGPVATTGVNGFALQNATPTILTWVVPNDGQMHRFAVFGGVNVTSGETGGAIGVTYKYPDGTSSTDSLVNGGLSSGHQLYNARLAPVQAGATVTVNQTSALTGGTASTWAEIWGS